MQTPSTRPSLWAPTSTAPTSTGMWASSRALMDAAVVATVPASHLRVVDARRADAPDASAYLDVGARVVRLTPGRTDDVETSAGYHAVVDGSGGTPRGVRPDDVDVVLWDGSEHVSLGWLTTRLAAGGLIVLPATAASRARGCGLCISATEQPDVMVAHDPRAARPLPPALQTLDRTMSVDRPAVLRALRGEPFVGPQSMALGTAAVARDQSARLLSALSGQLERDAVDASALPWPTHVATVAGTPGCDVLAVLPHPDDETIYLGGTMAALSRAGQSVRLVVATDGGAGRGGGHDLARVRAAELIDACQRLGVGSVQTLGWPDTGKYRDAERSAPMTAADAINDWGGAAALDQLVTVIRRARPRTLLGLDPQVDPNLSLHGHHLGLGTLLAVAFHVAADPSYGGSEPAAWACHEHRVATAAFLPASALAPADVVEVDRTTKLHALDAYASQAYSTRRLVAALSGGQPAREATRRAQARRATPWLLAIPSSPTRPLEVDWTERQGAVVEAPRDRQALAEIMARQHAQRPGPADSEALASIQMLRDPKCVAVVAGQQVGWLGGPVYTLTKALAAVAHARRLTRRGIPAVPVFWMASQDHDALEVNTAPRLGASDVRLRGSESGGPVGRAMLPEDVASAIDGVARDLPAAAAGRARRLAQRHYVAGRTYAQAFASLLAELTRGTGLLILEPDDASVAALARPVYARELLGECPAATPLAASDALTVAPVVPIGRDVSQVFFVDDAGVRQRLRRTSTGVAWRGGQMTREDVARWLEDAPERFSPAALLRPVVQDLVLPAIATIAGPTERRYLEQMRGLYPWAGVAASTVVTRPRLRPLALEDLSTLASAGGLEALAGDDQPFARLGWSGLAAPARRWLRGLDDLLATVHRARRSLRRTSEAEGVDIAVLDKALAALDEDANAALAGLRTCGTWSAHHGAMVRLLSSPDVPVDRALRGMSKRLFQTRRSVLRDGRREAPQLVAAWRRCRGAPEREQTCVEFVARFGEGAPAAVLAALESGAELRDGGTLTLLGSGTR